MKIIAILLLAAATAAYAEPPKSEAPGAPKALPLKEAPRALHARDMAPPPPPPPPPAPAAEAPQINYRIRLSVQEGREPAAEWTMVLCEGKIRGQFVQPKRVVIDDREIPTTMSFTGVLTPAASGRHLLNFNLGRTFPYVTGKSSFGGNSQSQYQQMSIAFDTSVLLRVGKPVCVQSDPSSQITVALEELAE